MAHDDLAARLYARADERRAPEDGIVYRRDGVPGPSPEQLWKERLLREGMLCPDREMGYCREPPQRGVADVTSYGRVDLSAGYVRLSPEDLRR